MLNLSDLSPDQNDAMRKIGAWFAGVDGKVRYCDDEVCAPYDHTHGQEGVEAPVYSLGGEAGCVAGETELWDPIEMKGVKIEDLYRGKRRPWVQTLVGPVLAEVPFLKGTAPLYRVTLANGRSCLATADHLFLSTDRWRRTDSLAPGMALLSGSPAGALHCSGTLAGCQDGCSRCHRRCDPPLPSGAVADPAFAPSRSGAPTRTPRGSTCGCSLASPRCGHPSTRGSILPEWVVTSDWNRVVLATQNAGCRDAQGSGRPTRCSCQRDERSPQGSLPPQRDVSPHRDDERNLSRGEDLASRSATGCRGSSCTLEECSTCRRRESRRSDEGSCPQPTEPRSCHDEGHTVEQACLHYTSEWSEIVSVRYERTDVYYDLHVPVEEHYLADGIWSHNTGKTTVMRWLEAALACHVGFAVPTHKAARVLRSKLDPGARERVNTFHSLVYYPNSRTVCLKSRLPVRESGGSVCVCGTPDDCSCARQFEPCGRCKDACVVDEQLRWDDRPYLRSHLDLLVIDESSMVSEEDLVRIRAFGVPVLLVGDHGQLPPVLARMNRWTANPDVSLTENHRQANDTSGIVDVALAFRGGKKPSLGTYGDGRALIIGRHAPGMDNLLRPERYRERGVQPPAIICPWNKLRANVNKKFHGSGPVIRAGDRVVALSRCAVPLVRNIVGPDTAWGGLDLGDTVTAHNGMQGTVMAVVAERAKTADLVVNVEELGTVLVANVALAQFGRDKPLALNERPMGARLWDYAYAITAHKAQGSEWEDVLVLEESPQDYARWCYTAVTRAKSRLIVARY